MARYGFTSPGAMAGNAIQEFLMQRALQERQAMLDKLAQERQAEDMGLRQRQVGLQEKSFAAQQQRQAEQDRIDAEDRQRAADERDTAKRRQTNTEGVRGMMADAMTQGLTPEAAKTIGIMAFREGMPVPPEVERVLHPPKPAQFSLGEGDVRYDEHGNVIARGNPKRQPTGGDPEMAELRKTLTQMQIDAAKEKQETERAERQRANTARDNAAQNTITLLDRLDKHPGLAASTGAYEMRGFTQDARNADALKRQIVAALTAPNLGTLKGPASDKDVAFIKDLSSRIQDTNISDEELKQAIADARSYLQTGLIPQTTGGTPPVGATDTKATTPAGGGGFRVVGVR